MNAATSEKYYSKFCSLQILYGSKCKDKRELGKEDLLQIYCKSMDFNFSEGFRTYLPSCLHVWQCSVDVMEGRPDLKLLKNPRESDSPPSPHNFIFQLLTNKTDLDAKRHMFVGPEEY